MKFRRRASVGRATFSLLAICVFANSVKAREPRQPQPFVQEQKAPTDHVVAQGTLSQAVSTVGETLQFNVAVQNRGGQAVFDIRWVRLRVPGFKVLSLCIDSRGLTSCSGLSGRGGNLIAADLLAGQTTTIWGELEAQEPHARQILEAVIRWRDARKGESELPVNLGDSLIHSRWDHPLTLLSQITKDFTLPVVLVLLGLGYQRRDKKREEARQEQERKRTILDQTWNSMLWISHQYATKHYMPMAAYLGKAVSEISRYKAATTAAQSEGGRPSDTADLGFYYFSLFFRHRRHLVATVGGLYFKDRVGEALAASCMDKFVELYIGGRKERQIEFSALLNHIELHETADVFFAKLAGKVAPQPDETKGAFERARGHFQDWLDSTSVSYC